MGANISRFKLLRDIFISFAKIGPVTFGGGYAMIPLIEKEVVIHRKWVKAVDVADVFALSESIPGSIAVNSATFIGYRIAGVMGAIAALLGVMIPTFLIVLGLCISYFFVKDNVYVAAAFKGIRPAIVALIAYAGYKIGLTAILDKTTLAFTVLSMAAMLLFNHHIHPVALIIGGGIVGIVTVMIRKALGMVTRMDKHEKHSIEESAAQQINKGA
ncbi:MAG: chromate transporter [Paenibacillaceae bacterium]|jgi:chromate transporter|nr:chromate transporter [Paenibacillaceae bacterium]